jgi:TRAP-type C4-dicarboxylate transport system permease small subunit
MSFAYQEDEGGVTGPRPSFEWQPPWLRFLRAVIRYWALLGGVILAALMLMTAASTFSNLLFDKPFQGDYEMMKHFVAVAIFCFLPYCQLTGANVTVDIFTEGMSERAKSAMLAFSSLFAIVLALVLLRQMSLGLIGYIEYPETTAALHIPLWTAFPPALVSLFLLLVAALITLAEGFRGALLPHAPPPTSSPG